MKRGLRRMLIVAALFALCWGGCESGSPLDIDTDDAAPSAAPASNIHQQAMDDWIAAFSGRYRMIGQYSTDVAEGWVEADWAHMDWADNARSVILLNRDWLDIAPKKEGPNEYHTLTIRRAVLLRDWDPIEYLLLSVDLRRKRLILLALNYPAQPFFELLGHGQSPMFHMVVAGYVWDAENQILTLIANTAFGGVLITRWHKWNEPQME